MKNDVSGSNVADPYKYFLWMIVPLVIKSYINMKYIEGKSFWIMLDYNTKQHRKLSSLK